MIYVTILLKVKDPARVDEVRDLLVRHGRLSLAEPGCARFEIHQEKNDPTRFILAERWESEALLDAHRKAEGYTTIYAPLVIPLVDREARPCQLILE
jgi:4-carboxymuconolactone decarboxylase